MSLLNLLNKNRRQKGSILIFTVLLLGSMLAIALTLAAIFIPKIRAVTNASGNSVSAIYAADSALEWCLYTNRGNTPEPSPSMTNGATYNISSADCLGSPLSAKTVGTFNGVSRSLELDVPATSSFQ